VVWGMGGKPVTWFRPCIFEKKTIKTKKINTPNITVTLNKTFWKELIAFFHFIRRGPHRKLCAPSCCTATRSLPGNDRRDTHTDTEQTSCSHKSLFIFQNKEIRLQNNLISRILNGIRKNSLKWLKRKSVKGNCNVPVLN
jgi:hypothetical protein